MMYKKQNTFAKKSFFSLLFIMILGVWGSLLFTSCKNIFETAIPSQEEDESASASSAGNTQESGTNESSLPPPVIVHGQIIITGAVPEVNSTVIQNGRAAVPAYIASEVEYFATATNGSTTVNGSFGSDDTATTFELPLTPGQDWSITCGLKKLDSGSETGATLFSASTDDPIDPEDLAEDTVLKFYPTPDVSGGSTSTGEIDLSMTVDSSIVKYKTTCISDNSAYWPFSTPNPIEITGTTATIKTDSSNPSVRSGAYEVIIDFYKAGNVIAYSTVQTINVCKNLKTKTWIASGGLTPIESDGTFNVTAAKIASYVNTYIYVGTVEGGTPASDTKSGNHTAPFLTLSRAISYIEDIATAEGADTSLEYKIFITGEVNNTPDTTVPEIGSSLNGKAGKIIIKGRGTNPSIQNPNPDGRVLTIGTTVPVEISKLTIKDGNASGSDAEGKGGALYISGSGAAVTLKNCTISNCSANSSGGGLFVSGEGTNVTLTNTTIRDCSANTFGGALYVADGTASSPALVTLNSCLIGGELESCADSTPVTDSGSNSANGGGGICIESNGKAVLSNTKVIGNIAQNYGGGIRCVAGTLDITNGQINYNYSGDSGGGLFVMGTSSVTINKCTIGKTWTDSDTTATGLTDCGNYSASNGGGGIRIEGGSITTTEGYNVVKNYSAGTNANGGGISTSVALILRNTRISYNKTTGDGGGVFIEGAVEVSVRVTNSNYTNYINNNSAVNGGGVYVSNTGAAFKTVESPYIDENTATNGAGIYSVGLLDLSYIYLDGNHASSNGGGIYTTGTMFLYGFSRIGSSGVNGPNIADSAGGGIYNTGSLYLGYIAWTDEATNTVASRGGSIVCNSAPLGSAIYNIGSIQFTKGTINLNNTINFGAGLYIAGGSVTLNGTASIHSNTAQQRGAGIYVDATTENVSVTIGGTAEIVQNKSVETGGAIYVENGATTSATITLKDGIKIPYYTLTGTNATTYAGKNDVYLPGGLVTVSETEPLTDTAEINLTPASYTIGQSLLTGTGIDVNYSKFTVTPDSSHPNESWAVSSTGKLCKPVLKSSSYSSIADFSNAIKNDEDNIDVIIDSDITAADLGNSVTNNTIAYGIRYNTNSNAKFSLYVAPGVTIPLDTAANASLFDSCSKLVCADLEGCTTSSVSDMSQWFMSCINLKELNLSGWNTSSVNSMTSMFDGCTRLEKIYVSTFVTAMASSSNNMFYGCTSIIGGLGTTFDSGKTNRDYAHLDGGDTNPGYFSSFQIGSKAMGSTLELGDIIFSDGSAEPYSESLVLTPRQYLSAVAVIYDAENRKGVNLKEVRKAWAATSAEGYGIEIGTDADDGTANMAEIQALSDWSEAKYPAFWYADHYGESTPVAGSTEGWYLPAKNEMVAVIANITAVNNSIAKITGATALTKQTYYRYWTSNNYAAGTSISARKCAIFVDNGSAMSSGDPRFKQSQNYVRCIRVF